MYLMMIGIMMPRIIRTRDRISKSLIHIALLYESVKRGLFKKEVPLTFMRANRPPLWQHPNRICGSLFYQIWHYMAMFLFDTHGHQFAV